MMTRLHRKKIVDRLIVAGWSIGISIGLTSIGFAGESGQDIFQQKCAACHTVGGGKRVGPDLQGVTQRRAHAWLTRWIREPDKMLSEGDAQATQLFKEYNNVPMPNLALTEADVAALVAYLETALKDGAPTAASTESATVAVPEPTTADVELGRNLFQGTARFANGGPSCTSCHHVKNDAVIGGGILARELTTVFSRMGGDGVRAILGGPPFPVMQAAFKGKPFTENETRALVGFLQHADKEHAYQQPRDYGWGLFVSGGAGAAVLMGFFGIVGRRRKKRSVNQDLYDRQDKSE